MNKSKILQFYKEYNTPKNVIAHMKQVAKICENLANKFEDKGVKINKELLLSAALLHDALRVCDIKNYNPFEIKKNATKEDIRVWEDLRKKYYKMGHEKAISKLLKERGESKIANLILKHDFYLIDKLKTWEEKILYYADKRVDHDKIVSLKKRFKEGKKRNNGPGDDFALIGKVEEKIILLEKEIFSFLRCRI